MKLHRFIGSFDLKKAHLEIRDKELAHQLGRVLKLEAGERIILCDGQGGEAVYEIELLDQKTVSFRIREERRPNSAEPKRHVVLYAAILKRENFEWSVQKAVECGVMEIVPVVSDRTIKKDVKQGRLQEISKEAAEQSGRGRVPLIHPPMSFRDALEHAKQNDRNLFLDVIPVTCPEQSRRKTGIQEPGTLLGADTRIGLFIGPEGGWSGEEAERARKAKWETISLGPRVLRGETAAAIATYLASSGSS